MLRKNIGDVHIIPVGEIRRAHNHAVFAVKRTAAAYTYAHKLTVFYAVFREKLVCCAQQLGYYGFVSSFNNGRELLFCNDKLLRIFGDMISAECYGAFGASDVDSE